MIWLVIGVMQYDIKTIKVHAESLDEALNKARKIDMHYCCAKPYESQFDDRYFKISDLEI